MATNRLIDVLAEASVREKRVPEFLLLEVTQALGRQRLVLFIDDLDRCRPDHVLAILETINFLASSGDCFVIAGMDRDRVEHCVAMRFEEESKALGADQDGDGVADPLSPVRYAQLYLEKLLNIEVPIPQATETQSRRLVDEPEKSRQQPFGAGLCARDDVLRSRAPDYFISLFGPIVFRRPKNVLVPAGWQFQAAPLPARRSRLNVITETCP